MAVQITGRQIANAAVDVNKLDLSSGTFDFQNAVLQVAEPSSDNQAATKAYVDSIAQGLHWKDSARIATTANITLSGTQTIDGVSVVADDRVLVKNQTSGAENGLYLCKAGSWERTADMNESDEFSGSAVFIREGSTFADTGYVCTNDGAVTVGSTAITFVQFTGAGQVEAGSALTKTGNRLDVAVDNSSIGVSSDALQVKAGGITNAMLAGSIANAKLANSSVSFGGVSLSLGGSNATPTFNLSNATDYPTSSLSGTIATAQIADSAVTAVKLAGSIPADKLNLGNGVEEVGGNLQINLDGSTLALAADGISIAAGGVDSSQLADGSVVTNKIPDAQITTQKLKFGAFFQGYDADGSTLAFELGAALDLDFVEMFVITVNGLVMEYKATPDAQDNYKIDNGGTGGVGRIVFGANLNNSDRVTVRGFIND